MRAAAPHAAGSVGPPSFAFAIYSPADKTRYLCIEPIL